MKIANKSTNKSRIDRDYEEDYEQGSLEDLVAEPCRFGAHLTLMESAT